jgi:hypothetical protein
MAANPNPGRITGPLWDLWLGCSTALPGVRLSGIYANKSGYHNTRAANQASWPGNYSIRVSLDLQGPADKAAALDLTLSDAEMRRRTGYLRGAAAAGDPRMAAVREFYGTVDSRTVFGRIKDSRGGAWRSSSADSTHLWHIHISFFRAYVATWSELAPILSVLSGQSLAAWRANPTVPVTGQLEGSLHMIGLTRGDKGQPVRYLQRKLKEAGFDPGNVDEDYGPKTEAAVLACRKAEGSSVTSGARVDAEGAVQIERAWLKATARKAGLGGGVSAADLAAAVADFLKKHPPKPGADGKTPKRVKLEQYADVVEVE